MGVSKRARERGGDTGRTVLSLTAEEVCQIHSLIQNLFFSSLRNEEEGSS